MITRQTAVTSIGQILSIFCDSVSIIFQRQLSRPLSQLNDPIKHDSFLLDLLSNLKGLDKNGSVEKSSAKN